MKRLLLIFFLLASTLAFSQEYDDMYFNANDRTVYDESFLDDIYWSDPILYANTIYDPFYRMRMRTRVSFWYYYPYYAFYRPLRWSVSYSSYYGWSWSYGYNHWPSYSYYGYWPTYHSYYYPQRNYYNTVYVINKERNRNYTNGRRVSRSNTYRTNRSVTVNDNVRSRRTYTSGRTETQRRTTPTRRSYHRPNNNTVDRRNPVNTRSRNFQVPRNNGYNRTTTTPRNQVRPVNSRSRSNVQVPRGRNNSVQKKTVPSRRKN